MAVSFFDAAKNSANNCPSLCEMYGIFFIASGLLWSLVAVVDMYLLLRVHRWYKAQGGRNLRASDVAGAGAGAAATTAASLTSSGPADGADAASERQPMLRAVPRS